MSRDTYSSIEELQKHEVYGKDYDIICIKRNHHIAIVAIHGGGIEKMTSQLAEVVAEKLQATFYTFRGLKDSRNKVLHVTSARFCEPEAISVVRKSYFTISIHGAWGERAYTYVGGADREFIKIAVKMLKKYGFCVEKAPESINGNHPKNIVNRNRRRKGLQLEITEEERSRFVTSGGQLSPSFWLYVKAICEAARTYIEKHEV